MKDRQNCAPVVIFFRIRGSYAGAVRLLRRRPRLRAIDIHRLLTPYVSIRFIEQVRAVVPLALMLVGFQALALRTSLLDANSIMLGILAVIIGLMFFMAGCRQHGAEP